MKIPKFKIKEIKQFLKKLPRTLGERSFLTFLGLLLIAIIFSGFIFYKYSPPTKIGGGLEALEKPLKFNERVYQEVLKIWQEKEKKFEETNFKKYPDPFQPTLAEKRLSEERTQELLAISFIQELLNTANLYEFYTAKGEELLLIEERAQIWEELGLGKAKEYQGTYSQNIRLLEELKKELTP